FVPAPDHVLSGPLDIDLDIAGTPAAPQAGGRIAMAGGQYQNLETGTILTDLTLASDIAADGGFRLDLDARDGADGSLAAEIAIDAGQLAARLTADGATLIRRDDVTARLSADIAADGPIASPAITGEVRVDRAEVSLLGALPPSVADLGDVRFVDEPEPEAPAEDSAVAPLDLRIVAPGDVFVRGRGLDSEWRMDLEVTGSLLAPRIAGAVERVRGRLDFLGRNFELERGAVRFTGAREIDPVLDISLEHDRDGFIGRIVVSGVASDPELAFTSSPPVPEGEVLPRTIFGEDSQSLGPGDALLLANGIAALTGQGGGGSGVRDALGLDVLRLDESADGTAEVSVGKNVTEDVFVGVNQPVDGSPSSVEVEVEVFPNFAVRAETGQEEGSTLGVEWRVDF
ncbi:MAG: translocation/assembly module TamB domain-containing protein, partial [Pseudomonadota bacterium]